MEETILLNLSTEEDPRMIQISSTLFSEEHQQLVNLLKEFKYILSWSYEDMLGIDHEVMQHRIPHNQDDRPDEEKLKRICQIGSSRLKNNQID